MQGLIEIENPNRVVKKAAEKVSKINLNAGPSKPELSRREREGNLNEDALKFSIENNIFFSFFPFKELEKQRSQAHYQKLHAEGNKKMS